MSRTTSAGEGGQHRGHGAHPVRRRAAGAVGHHTGEPRARSDAAAHAGLDDAHRLVEPRPRHRRLDQREQRDQGRAPGPGRSRTARPVATARPGRNGSQTVPTASSPAPMRARCRGRVGARRSRRPRPRRPGCRARTRRASGRRAPCGPRRRRRRRWRPPGRRRGCPARWRATRERHEQAPRHRLARGQPRRAGGPAARCVAARRARGRRPSRPPSAASSAGLRREGGGEEA